MLSWLLCVCECVLKLVEQLAHTQTCTWYSSRSENRNIYLYILYRFTVSREQQQQQQENASSKRTRTESALRTFSCLFRKFTEDMCKNEHNIYVYLYIYFGFVTRARQCLYIFMSILYYIFINGRHSVVVSCFECLWYVRVSRKEINTSESLEMRRETETQTETGSTFSQRRHRRRRNGTELAQIHIHSFWSVAALRRHCGGGGSLISHAWISF